MESKVHRRSIVTILIYKPKDHVYRSIYQRPTEIRTRRFLSRNSDNRQTGLLIVAYSICILLYTICYVHFMLSTKVLENLLHEFLEFNIGEGVNIIGFVEHCAVELPKCVIDAPESHHCHQCDLKCVLKEASISFMVGDIFLLHGELVCAIPEILCISGIFPIQYMFGH